MSITDELRAWVTDHYSGWKSKQAEGIAIADRIDAAVDGMVKLPVDADGEPIHMGDLVTVPWKDKVYEVAGFSCSKQLCSGIRTIWIVVYSQEKQRIVPLCGADSCHHYHAPTVEDVLTEFGIDWEHESDCEDRAALLKEYASKLKLAEGEDA